MVCVSCRKEAGLGLGIVLLIVMGYITDYSISLLVRTGYVHKLIISF